MRPRLGTAAAAAWLLTVGTPAAWGQWETGVGAQGGPRVLVATTGEPVTLDAPPLIAPDLQPAFYAGELLPRSLSHPWVMAPRNANLIPWNVGHGYGYRTSPYGDYSRYAYRATAAFPGLPRPAARFTTDHGHRPASACATCP